MYEEYHIGVKNNFFVLMNYIKIIKKFKEEIYNETNENASCRNSFTNFRKGTFIY